MNWHEASANIELMEKIDEICSRFEAEHKADKNPQVEDFLDLSGGVSRELLLRELLLVDIEYRRRSQGEVSSEDYESRFPDDGDVLRRVFEKSTLAKSPDTELVVRCPNCNASVEIGKEKATKNLTCRACQTQFDFIVTETDVSLRQIGRFELLERVGSGGFGSVWSARDMELNRRVAVKLPHLSMLGHDEAERLMREARTAASLKHPNIVRVYEVGREGAYAYIISDLIEGKTLTEKLKEATLPYQESAALCAKLAGALNYAHEKGVVHRDLKPGNVLMDTNDQPHITDFGLAKHDVGDVTVTHDGAIMGTPAYMPPEQAQGESHLADRRSDVYSLGVVLFEMITGHLPFRGNRDRVMYQIIHDSPPEPRTLASKVPRDLNTICMKCLEKAPADRYQSAQSLLRDFECFLRGEPITARPVGNAERVVRWCKRKPAIATLSAVAAGLAIMFSIQFVVNSYNERNLNRQLTNAEGAIDRQWEHLAEDPRMIAEGLEPARKELMRELLPFYEKRASISGNDPSAQVLRAQANFAYGLLTAQFDSMESAIVHVQKAHDIYDSLVTNHPGETDYRVNKAIVLRTIGYMHMTMDQFVESSKAHQEAVNILNGLVKNSPENIQFQRELANANNYLGEVFINSEQFSKVPPIYEPAIEMFRDLVAKKADALHASNSLGETTYFFAMTLFNMGLAQQQLGNQDQAEAYFTQSCRRFEQLNVKFPDVPKYRHRLARSYLNYGQWLLEVKRLGESIEYHNRALTHARPLVAQHPHVHEYRKEVVSICFNLSICYQRIGDPGEQRACLIQARRHLNRLIEDDPNNDDFKSSLAEVHNQLGSVGTNPSDAEFPDLTEALDLIDRVVKQNSDQEHLAAIETLRDIIPRAPAHEYMSTIEILEGLMAGGSKDLNARVVLGGAYCNYANQIKDNDSDLSLSYFDKAIATLMAVLKEDPSDQRAQSYLQISRRLRDSLTRSLEQAEGPSNGKQPIKSKGE